jgi:hypothetical protein
MKRFTEFRGTITRIGYDAEHCTFGSIAELHPFLPSAPTGGDTDGHARQGKISAPAQPAGIRDAKPDAGRAESQDGSVEGPEQSPRLELALTACGHPAHAAARCCSTHVPRPEEARLFGNPVQAPALAAYTAHGNQATGPST